MTLQVLPPELMEAPKIKLKLKNHNHTGNQAAKDGESRRVPITRCYETGHAIVGWQYASECRDSKTGDLRFNGYVVTRSHPGQPDDLARETD